MVGVLVQVTFQAAADRVTTFAGAKTALPAKTLLLDAGGFGLRTHMRRIAGAVAFAEGVSAGDECNRLLVVHGHASEGLANVLGRTRVDPGCRSGLPD